MVELSRELNMKDKISYSAEEATYRHSIIQFSQALLSKYVLTSDTNKLSELSIYGYLFGKLLNLDKQQLTKLLEFEKNSSDSLLNTIWAELLRIDGKKDQSISSSFRLEIDKYLKSRYSGQVDDSRAKSLVGDTFLLLLLESSLGLAEKDDKVLTGDILRSLKEGKTQDFLKFFIGAVNGSTEEISKESILQYPELSGYLKMIIANLQYQEFLELEKFSPQGESVSLEELKYLEHHLNFMKTISTDMYEFIEREDFQFRPSDSVIIKYFYLASCLVKTEYDNSISLNRSNAVDFFRLKLGDEKSLKSLINERINEEIDPQREFRPSLIWILNPFKELKDYFGIVASWILWAIALLLLIASSPYYTSFLSSYSINAFILEITLKPEYVPVFFGVWLFASLVGLFVYLVRLRYKSDSQK